MQKTERGNFLKEKAHKANNCEDMLNITNNEENAN